MKKEAFQYIWFFVILVSIGLVLLGSFSILGFLVFNPSGELTTDPSVVLLTHMNGNVLDNSGNNNQGNIIGNVDCNVQGKFNQGCGFDSQSEYITIPDSGSLDLTNALTISAWVYPKGSTGRTQAIAYKYASYGLTLNNNLYAFAEMCYTTGNCNNNVQSSNQLTTNQWHHVVFTFDGANLKIYVDGVLAGTRARQGVIQKTNTNLQIGLVSNWNFNGAIDELVVFNRALSESEILELYNAQPSQTQPPQTCTENWQCSSWDSCVDDIQTRTCLDNNNCGTINNKPVTTQACTTPMQDATQPTCQENWQCNVWSACINGKQVRECIDINNCGTTNNLPQVQRDCQLQECRENWECTAFGSCVDGLQERFCIEKNNCGTTNNKPITTQPCTEEGIIQKLTGQEECEIKRVEWTDLNGNRKDTALNGETVYLTVETENCEGKAVDYNILETDGVFGVEEEDKDSGVVINGKARKSYAARWKEDKVLGIFPGGDPDLFFRAKINPEGTSNVLTVLQQEAGEVGVVAVGCTHYVDINSIGGACSDSNSGTSETNPWCTLGKAASTAAAGNVVCVRAGIYTGTLSPANSGTAGNLITFKAYPGDECVQASDYNVRPVCMVKLSSTVNFNLKSFVRVEGFEISNGGGSGFYCQDRDQEVVKGVEMVNNYIHDMDDYGIDCRNVHDALIENNYIHDVPGSAGIGLRGDRVATNVTIRGNKILRITCDGMDIQGKNIIIENNVLGDSFRSGCHPDAFEITEPVNGLIIRNNRIFDFTQYIYGGPNDGTPSSVFENVYIYGNVLYNDKYWQENGGEAPGIFLASPQSSPTVVRNLYIHSNTFGWLGYPAIRLLAGGGRAPMDNVVIHNNIFYQSGIDIAPAVTNVNSNYNLFYTKPSAPSGPNDDTATPYPSEGPNSIIGQDPQFVNYDFFNNFDFRLKSASPAIDKGDPNLAVLFTLPLPFKDTDGTSRPQGSALDMGAYEFPQIVSCNTNADCNNGLFCDGQEVCSGGLCSDGADPCIADSYSCTTTCDEATDSCNVLNNAACNDNNACTINDRCVGATGDSITGCAYDFAASGTSCTISGAQCASAQQCNGAGTCTATANVALCTNPNNCASVSCNANNYQCEYSGCACQTSSSAWTNNGFTSQTGTFTVEFDATPNNAAMDGVIGLSNGAQTAYSSFSALVRFKSTGNIDVYDSTGYRYDVLVPYTASTAYHIKMIVNVPAQTYDVFVRAGSGSEQQIANDYRFRSTALASSLNNWGFISSTGTLDVCNFVVNVQEAVCGDGICSVGEICPQDAVGCADNICYEPTCTNGCGQVAVASGGTDESCVAPNSCNGAGVCVSPPAVCGNGIVETGEQCDDGNTITESCAYGQTSCTVCNNICQLVSGATAYCGDSIINGAEQCDDGNTISGDGCSSICQNELSCSLTSASWSQTSVVEGTQVNLNVQGNNCAGQNFNYTIYEDDILVDDVVTSFVSTSLNPTWTSVYVNDGIGDPEYYFITRVVSNPAENIQSIGLLTVTRAPTTQCNDGIDNDGDGAVDYPNDFGCVDINDNSEINNGATQCSDGIDNDGDGRIDQADSDCFDRNDNSEAAVVAVGCTHYVDINSIGGACSDSNSGTSETNPWCTLGKAASTAAAGNVVCVRAGTYSETLRPANSGTAGNLITFKAYPGEECTMSTDYTVRPTCSVWIGGATINRNYVKVEGFEFANHPGEPIVCGINTNNISIVNNYIHDSGDNGISCVISNNLLIERNYIRDTGNNGMDLRIGIGISTNITIRGNAILDTECDGMDFTGNNIVFENNVLGIIDRFSGCHQDGMEVTEPVNGLIIRNNRIFDYTQLIYLAPDGPSIENVEIYGNIIYLVNYGGDAPGIVVGSPVRNVSIHSNTFGDLHGNAGIRMSGGDDVTARNNIFYIGRISGGDDPELNSNYNIFFSPTGGRIIDSETNLDTYRSTHPGRETNSIQADPLFVNYDYIGKSSFDFRLKSASPAIDKGDPNLAALFTLPLPFKDTDGTSRPQGSALDMGAYEFPQIVSCNTNADCNNGLFCDGQEVCSAGLCSDSADPCIADSYSCTTTCDEATDSCNVLNNAACNDNNACTINDRCVGATGDSITGCAYDFAASGTSCTISGAQCASAQQCNGAGTCTATANVALCTNPNNCASVSCNANNYQCEYSGCACQTSSSTWTNNGFTSQTGTFTVEFDSTPNNAAMDGVIGLSNGAQTAYSSFSALVRFNSGGVIDVYDSTGYRADVLVPYTASTAYHIKMIVNVPAQTYDAFVRVGSGSEQQIANDYRFRSTALATSLNNWAIYSSSGTLNVCNFVLSTPLTCTDNDLDGYNQSASGCGTADCNDNNALEKPGQIWYVDSDNDGYSTLLAVTQCSRPLGYKAASELISISGDCNDANPSIKPGATEICDGLDNNCDTTIDNGGNALCNNGAFCDGVEICGGTSGCQVGTVPCNPATHTCIEATDSCQLLPGTCTTNADCSDGIFCNGAESCVGGSCIAGTQVVCNDNITCTIDSCSAVFDTCVFSANHAGCDNGQYCDGTELCVVDVGCQTGTPITCAPDSFSCTDDTCNEVTDECIYQENNAGCPLYSQGQICSIANFPAPTGCGFVQNCVDADNDGLLDYNINKCPIGKDYCDYTNKTYFENNPNELIRYLPDRGDYNISEVNLSNIFNYSNFTIKLENIGEIIFREGINLIRINESGCFEKLNFNITDLIKIEDKRIFVNGSMHSEFSKPAKLIFQNINFVQPKILRDGAECSSSACLIVNYSNNRLEVEVPGFSLYEVVEGFVSPPPGDGGGGGGGGGGGTRPRACAVEWACTSWGDCIDGIQTRTCFDNKNCNVLTNKPTERQECRLTAGIVTNETAVAPGDIVGETVKWFTEKAVIILIVVLTIVLIAIIIVLTVTRSRKTENKKQELISGSMGNRFMNYVQENKLVSFLIVFIFSLFLLSVVFNDKNKILLSPSDALGSNFAIGISLIVLLILIILLLKGEKKEGGIERDREKVLKNIRKEFR